MSTTKTVWLDVTDMEQWSGHMTGVQRVVYECMCRLQADISIAAAGFSYDPYRNEVFAVDLNDVVQRVSQATSTTTGPNRTAKLKSLARTMYFRTPSSVRARITPAQKQFAIRSAKKALKAAHHGLHTARSLR